MSDVQYSYTKKRADFGRHCNFGNSTKLMVENIQPNKALCEEYIRKDPVDKSTQHTKQFALHELNTIRAEYESTHINHVEGGWPKDVNYLDVEHTLRFRKKIEKDEMYIHTVLQLSHPMEHVIHQNNAINIYELYFSDIEEGKAMEKISSRTINVFRDPNTVKRPVQHLSWSPDGGTRLAVTHANLEFQRAPHDLCTHSYIWEVENPNSPDLVLKPKTTILSLEYHPKDPHCLVSGFCSGQVGAWDTRKGSEPCELSNMTNSHRDPVLKVLWINSKSGTEFFSASTDGQMKWWDTRKLDAPLETLLIDLTKGDEQLLSRSLGISALEYDASIPIRFMIGTETGIVISGNRKGKTTLEKLTAQFKAHQGPVYALHRNPSFVKNFLSVGDWTAKIWTEDCRESAIIWTSNYRHLLTNGAWSPTKYSVFYTTSMDGSLDAWDILNQQREPSLSVKMFDRESRREKIIEAKLREQRLKSKAAAKLAAGAGALLKETKPHIQINKDDQLVIQAEEEFFAILAEQKEMQDEYAEKLASVLHSTVGKDEKKGIKEKESKESKAAKQEADDETKGKE
nr:PREDICTED: dynein intermediate chain 2, axonemal [Bemisia tabaci]